MFLASTSSSRLALWFVAESRRWIRVIATCSPPIRARGWVCVSGSTTGTGPTLPPLSYPPDGSAAAELRGLIVGLMLVGSTRRTASVVAELGTSVFEQRACLEWHGAGAFTTEIVTAKWLPVPVQARDVTGWHGMPVVSAPLAQWGWRKRPRTPIPESEWPQLAAQGLSTLTAAVATATVRASRLPLDAAPSLVQEQREADAVEMAGLASSLPDGGAHLPPLTVYAADSSGTVRGDAAVIDQVNALRCVPRGKPGPQPSEPSPAGCGVGDGAAEAMPEAGASSTNSCLLPSEAGDRRCRRRVVAELAQVYSTSTDSIAFVINCLCARGLFATLGDGRLVPGPALAGHVRDADPTFDYSFGVTSSFFVGTFGKSLLHRYYGARVGSWQPERRVSAWGRG